MFISDTAITRPVLTVVAMMMLVVFGVVALFQLDTDEYPEIDAPVVVVAIPYPGASPVVVERADDADFAPSCEPDGRTHGGGGRRREAGLSRLGNGSGRHV